LPHGYCTECQARVTVRNGQCLLDHVVDLATIEETSGRRLRSDAPRRRGTHGPRRTSPPPRRTLPSVGLDPAPLGGGLAVLDRDIDPLSPAPMPPPMPRPVTDADTLSITGLLVEELWNLGPDEDILGWTPNELDTTLVQSGVRKRKVAAIGALVVVALLLGWRALTWESARAAESIEAVTVASAGVVDAVVVLDPLIEDLADGSVENPLGASTALAGLDDSARRLFGVAGDMPDDADMAPIREQAIGQSGGALTLGTMLSESVAYASAVQLITRPIELPAETDIDGLTAVTQQVTAWVNEFSSGVGALPGNDLTDTHRMALSDLAASLPDWQASYLDSLRARDAESAAGHVAELETQIGFVRSSWTGTAASIADWARERVAELAVPMSVNR